MDYTEYTAAVRETEQSYSFSSRVCGENCCTLRVVSVGIDAGGYPCCTLHMVEVAWRGNADPFVRNITRSLIAKELTQDAIDLHQVDTRYLRPEADEHRVIVAIRFDADDAYHYEEKLRHTLVALFKTIDG